MEIFTKAAELKLANQPFVIATVTTVEGSVPGKLGFKILVQSSGNTLGTVGGGAIEKHIIEESLDRLARSESGSSNYVLSQNARETKDVKVIPMSCSGRLSVFYEVHGEKPTVYVFGGGHVGQALLYYLKPINYHSILIDNREEYASLVKNPDADKIIFKEYEKYSEKFDPVEGSFVVILTHGHKYDEKILNILYQRKLSFPYIGIIASKSKAVGLLKRLKGNQGKSTNTSVIHTPVGLNIGGISAAEIALAIAAEIQSIRYNK